jgi:hypothetical protein
VEEAHTKEIMAKIKREEAERERDVFAEEHREKRRGELRDEYDYNLRINRIKFFTIPVVVAIIIFLVIKYFVLDQSSVSQLITGICVSIVFAILPLFPINKKLMRRHSEYVSGINAIVENEIISLKKKAQ